MSIQAAWTQFFEAIKRGGWFVGIVYFAFSFILDILTKATGIEDDPEAIDKFITEPLFWLGLLAVFFAFCLMYGGVILSSKDIAESKPVNFSRYLKNGLHSWYRILLWGLLFAIIWGMVFFLLSGILGGYISLIIAEQLFKAPPSDHFLLNVATNFIGFFFSTFFVCWIAKYPMQLKLTFIPFLIFFVIYFLSSYIIPNFTLLQSIIATFHPLFFLSLIDQSKIQHTTDQ